MEEQPLTDRGLLNMEDIWDFINTVDASDIKEILDRKIQYNWAIAEEGLRCSYGANIGKVLPLMPEFLVTACTCRGSSFLMATASLPKVWRPHLKMLVDWGKRA